MPYPATNRHDRGFTYLGLLLAIAVMSAVLGTTAEVWHTAVQREKERELLFVGNQFRAAIRFYYRDHARYPPTLEDLLKDSQMASTRRYLRKIYRDPVTGGKEWGLMRATGGGIMGVHSLSEAAPIKIAEFAAADSSFGGATKYSDWVFAYQLRRPSSVNRPSIGAGKDKGIFQQ